MFPALSATVIPHAQEVRFRRGDAFAIDVQFQDDYDPPNGVDISRSVVKFGAKQGFGKFQASNDFIVGNLHPGLRCGTREAEMVTRIPGRRIPRRASEAV